MPEGDSSQFKDPALLATGKGEGAPYNPSTQSCTPALLEDLFFPSQITQSTIPVYTTNGTCVPSLPWPASLRPRLPLDKKVTMASHRMRIKNVPMPQAGLLEEERWDREDQRHPGQHRCQQPNHLVGTMRDWTSASSPRSLVSSIQAGGHREQSRTTVLCVFPDDGVIHS